MGTIQIIVLFGAFFMFIVCSGGSIYFYFFNKDRNLGIYFMLLAVINYISVHNLS